MKVVVIGINHAGTSAIRTLLSINPSIEVVAFDRNDNISFLGCGIALTVSGVVKNTQDLFYSNPQELSSMGAKIHMNTDVIKVDRANKIITVKDLTSGETKEESYDKLIYAAGSWPIDLNFKNQHLKNIEICKLYQHALKLIDKANDDRIKKVAVIGSGYIGVELVEAFAQKGKEVALIDILSRPLGNYFDGEFTSQLEAAMRKHNINLYLGQTVKEFLPNSSGIEVGKVVTNKETIEADLVIMCVGFKPNTELLPDLKKVSNGALVINQKTQTSDPNIFAIGDCAAIYEASSKQYRHVALATNAVKTGIVAASQICGLDNVILPNIVGTNALCVFGLKYASTGLSEESARKILPNTKIRTAYYADNDRPEWMNTTEKVEVKIVFEEETFRLIGAQILSHGNSNHTEWIYALALAIQQGLNLFQVAFTDVYFLPHLNKPFNFVLSSILKSLGMKYIK